MPPLEFNEERHEYRLDGKIVPSVTQILRPLMDFSGIPPDVLEHKRQIGTAVHKAIELDLLGELDETSVAPALAPYFGAWRDFKSEFGVKDGTTTEYRVCSKIHGYAGTVDLITDRQPDAI